MVQHKASILKISDGEHNFPFLLLGKTLYCPDYNPGAFGDNPTFKFAVYRWDVGEFSHKTQIYEKIFELKDFEACPLFRYEAANYRHRLNMNGMFIVSGVNYYVELTPWRNDAPDENFVGAQGFLRQRLYPEKLICLDMVDRGIANTSVGQVYQTKLGFNITPSNFLDVAKECWGHLDSDITWSAEVALVDEDNMYWQSKDYTRAYGNYIFFDWAAWQFTNNYQFKPGLKLIGVLHFVITTDGQPMNIDITSEPFPLTQEYYARLISEKQETINAQDMNVTKLRIINKSVHNVVEMTSQTDSKANVVQPVFFRSRELAQIIVHPQVTENICINLDAYKSQVERFYIKIEGVSFSEIGRTESGVIFKIKGSLLPNTLQAGTYYILNENADLVTTGKYKYDF